MRGFLYVMRCSLNRPVRRGRGGGEYLDMKYHFMEGEFSILKSEMTTPLPPPTGPLSFLSGGGKKGSQGNHLLLLLAKSHVLYIPPHSFQPSLFIYLYKRSLHIMSLHLYNHCYSLGFPLRF